MTGFSEYFGKDNDDLPVNASSLCVNALQQFFASPATLAIATEASSHPTGMLPLLYQPYLYAGGGLGNVNECPLESCMAGSQVVFASVCVPHNCTAHDLAADDFVAKVMETSKSSVLPQVAQEYLVLTEQIAAVNRFLKVGWACGEYKVPFKLFPVGGLYVMFLCVVVMLSMYATFRPRRKLPEDMNGAGAADAADARPSDQTTGTTTSSLMSAWSLQDNFAKLFKRREACLDGLRVISILWVIFGHLMAIQSGNGAGFINPKMLLPPYGFVTTLGGQVVFAARFAVDTFFIIGGYLVFHAIRRRSAPSSGISTGVRYLRDMPGFVLYRALRILPLYATFMGFFLEIAPHIGSGPFWYQWDKLMDPCQKYAWTNFLFVNNFIPFGTPTQQTCFYQAWYLAVDMQLFLLAPLLVYSYQANGRVGKVATAALVASSALATLILSFTQQWSANSFDGAAVGRFDVEGYAMPHVRAQSYLAGLMLAMMLDGRRSSQLQSTWKSSLAMALAVCLLLSVTFVTVFGAYSRRPCQTYETPWLNSCGSTWNRYVTFAYTGTSRALWALSVTVIIGLCVSGAGGFVNHFLSVSLWTPLSHLSFGAYLVHPTVITVLQLGDAQKKYFTVASFIVHFIGVCCISFALALVFALLVELPMANLTTRLLKRGNQKKNRQQTNTDEGVILVGNSGCRYGSVADTQIVHAEDVS